MKFLFAGLLWAWAGLCAGATFVDHPLTYKLKKSAGEMVVLTFPFIETEDEQVADRINVYLHYSYFNVPPPEPSVAARDKAAFTLFDPESDVRSMADRGLKITNGGRIVSVIIREKSCGAYCNRIGDVVTSFDTRTGRLLLEDEIVSPEGRFAIGQRAAAAYATRLKTAIAAMKRQLSREEPLDRKTLRERRVRLEFYQNCLDERYTEGGREYASLGAGIYGMEINEEGLSFSDKCDFHDYDPLDYLGVSRYSLGGEALRPYLTEYGKYLLFGEGDGAVPAINRHAQVFRGEINGNVAITLYLALDNVLTDTGDTTAFYYYDKDRKPVILRTRHFSDQIELEEAGSVEEERAKTPKPVLRFRIVDEKLMGTWSGGGRTYPFEATP